MAEDAWSSDELFRRLMLPTEEERRSDQYAALIQKIKDRLDAVELPALASDRFGGCQ